MRAFAYIALFSLSLSLEASEASPRQKKQQSPTLTCAEHFSSLGLKKASIFLYAHSLTRKPEENIKASLWIQLKDPDQKAQLLSQRSTYSPQRFHDLIRELNLKILDLFADPDDPKRAFVGIEGKAEDVIAILDDPMIILAGPDPLDFYPPPDGLRMPRKAPHPRRNFLKSN